jgi:hypothetical protein
MNDNCEACRARKDRVAHLGYPGLTLCDGCVMRQPQRPQTLGCMCWSGRCGGIDGCACPCHKGFEGWMDTLNPARVEMSKDIAEAALIVGLTALSDFGPVVELAARLLRHSERIRKDGPCACDPATGKQCMSHRFTEARA